MHGHVPDIRALGAVGIKGELAGCFERDLEAPACAAWGHFAVEIMRRRVCTAQSLAGRTREIAAVAADTFMGRNFL